MVSRLTALIIQTRDDVVVSAGGPDQQGMYTGWVTLGPDDRYRPLFDTGPVFRTEDEAVAGTRKFVAELRAMETVCL